MSANQIYDQTVSRTYNTADNYGPHDALHAIIGLMGEVGELADAIKRHQFYGIPLDLPNVREELGDINYYVTALMKCYELDPIDVAWDNHDKLKKRYPEGFTAEAAEFRADKVGT